MDRNGSEAGAESVTSQFGRTAAIDARLALVALTLLALAGPIAAEPKITGDVENERCREALHLAQAAFRSTSASLLWPIAAPSRPEVDVVLRRNARDISGGDGIFASARAFRTLGGYYRTQTYWSSAVSAGKRLVVTSQPAGWRGNTYETYLLHPSITAEQFVGQLERQASGKPSLEPLLGRNRWNPPIVLWHEPDGDYWLIDRGEPYEVLADWKVHTITKDGLATPCRISFGSSPKGLERMPQAVRELADALDEALGPGSNEGTLQPTARIRLMVAKSWAIAALRPWALTDEPYNSREQVENGLAAWADGNAKRTALLRRIETLYPAAERELASYYAGRIEDRTSTAAQLSRKVLNHMFRSYFVFSTAVSATS